jgi:hypothetical protein
MTANPEHLIFYRELDPQLSLFSAKLILTTFDQSFQIFTEGHARNQRLRNLLHPLARFSQFALDHLSGPTLYLAFVG